MSPNTRSPCPRSKHCAAERTDEQVDGADHPPAVRQLAAIGAAALPARRVPGYRRMSFFAGWGRAGRVAGMAENVGLPAPRRCHEAWQPVAGNKKGATGERRALDDEWQPCSVGR